MEEEIREVPALEKLDPRVPDEGVAVVDGKVFVDGGCWYLELGAVLAGIKMNEEAIERGEKVEYHQGFLAKLIEAREIMLDILSRVGDDTTELKLAEAETADAFVPLSVDLIDKGKALIDGKIIVNFDRLFREIERLQSELTATPRDLQKQALLEAYLKAKRLMIQSIR